MRKIYIVHPDDEDMQAKSFNNRLAAEDYAAGLCCSYWIEEAEW